MKNFVLIFCFLGFANTLLSQTGLQVKGSKYSVVNETTNKTKLDLSKNFISQKNKKTLPSLHAVFTNDISIEKNASYFSMKKNRNRNSEMAFFCDIEAKVEKASKLPIRFRLGDVQTVDQKEGKWQQFQPLPYISN